MKKGLTALLSMLLMIMTFPVFVRPFSISADTITQANIVGTNVFLKDVSVYNTFTDNIEGQNYTRYGLTCLYEVEVILDDYYLGNIVTQIQGQYYRYPANSSTSVNTNFNYTRRVYVNDNKFTFTFSIDTRAPSQSDQLNRSTQTSPQVVLQSSSVTKFEDIDSIDQVINILTDIYNDGAIEGLMNDQLGELENLIVKLNLSNEFLATISQLRSYNFPLEFLTGIYSTILLGDGEIVDLIPLGSYNIPIFKYDKGDKVLSFWASQTSEFKFIIIYFGFNVGSSSNALSLLTQSGNRGTLSYVGAALGASSVDFRSVQYQMQNFSTSGTTTIICNRNGGFMAVPLLISSANGNFNVTSDVATIFNLSHPILDYYRGTQDSNDNADDLISGSEDLYSSIFPFMDQESQMVDEFNNTVNSIDLTSDNVTGNVNLMSSASFVKTVFSMFLQNQTLLLVFMISLILLLCRRFF